MKRDYRVYRLNKLSMLAAIIIYTSVLCTVSLLFYNSLIPCIFLIPCEPFLIRNAAEIYGKKCRRKLQVEFKDMTESLAANMSAGYSLERAFVPVYEEIHNLYEGKSYIEQEIELINKGLQLNVDIEVMLTDFGERSGVPDIREFAEVVSVAKKSGGNMVKIMRKTADNIKKRHEVENEIDTVITAKKMEQRIMSIMPCGIILYMRIANKGYMDVLYGNVAGVIIMTLCLAITVVAVCWGRRIVDIEV
ncbi:MAG: type II secretion system F family protein [Coprococcus sp.]